MPESSRELEYERIMGCSAQLEAARAVWPPFRVVRHGRDEADQPD